MTRTSFAVTALLGTCLLTAAGPGQAARIKCWTNDQGVRECGNTVPPKYAQQGHTERSAAGLTLRKQGKARDKDELDAERRAAYEAEQKAAEETQRRAAQAAKDRVLLDTYVSEADMNLAHEQKKSAIEQRVVHSRGHIKKLESNLAAMQAQAANAERAGKKVPEALLDDIGDVQRQIKEAEAFIAARGREQQKLDEQHTTDLDRFRFLKSGGVIGSPLQAKN